MSIECEWLPDCMGKQDYDYAAVNILCRMYPRGGGFFEVTRTGGVVEVLGNDGRPHIRPSALASVYLCGEEVAGASFEEDTEEAVKALVEAWAQEQAEKITAAIKALYAGGEA